MIEIRNVRNFDLAYLLPHRPSTHPIYLNGIKVRLLFFLVPIKPNYVIISLRQHSQTLILSSQIKIVKLNTCSYYVSGRCFAYIGRLNVKYSHFDKRWLFSIFIASICTSRFNFDNNYKNVLENILDSSNLDRTIGDIREVKVPLLSFYVRWPIFNCNINRKSAL